MAEFRAAQAADVGAIVVIDPQAPAAALGHASTSRVFTSTNQSNAPMRELRSEGWTASGVLSGLDDGDPEHVFFHDAVPS